MTDENKIDKIQNIEFFLSQVKNEFKKIKIIDGSIDISQHEKLVTSLFDKKIRNDIKKHSEVVNPFLFTDLFCGAGGLSLGLEQSGLIPDLAIDKDESALKTYHFNRPFMKEGRVINEDIRILAKEHKFKHMPLVVGGPPCQGFSNANKQKKENDDRNFLYKFYVHSVSEIQPDIFLLENVEGILTHLDKIANDFGEIGYTLSTFILNTRDFGFPQHRKRVFILGISNKHEKILDEIRGIFSYTIQKEKSNKLFNLADAIIDLPKLEAKTKSNDTYSECNEWGYTFGYFNKADSVYANYINKYSDVEFPILNHKSKYNNSRDIEIYSLLKPGETSNSESIKDINPYKNRDHIFKDKFFKLQQNEPCKTITAHMYYDCHMYIHPNQARGLTPREAARIQGFSDDYFFLGTPNEWYRQIGNAVSPLIARVLGKALHNILRRIYRI